MLRRSKRYYYPVPHLCYLLIIICSIITHYSCSLSLTLPLH